MPKEKESPTPMSAQRAYSRAAESIALDSRLSTSPVKSKSQAGKTVRKALRLMALMPLEVFDPLKLRFSECFDYLVMHLIRAGLGPGPTLRHVSRSHD